MDTLVLRCELNSEDSLTLRFGFMSMGSVWMRAQHGGKIAFILLSPTSVRALHAHLSGFVNDNEHTFSAAPNNPNYDGQERGFW